MNIWDERRRVAGHMVCEPITAFIAANAATIATSAAIGAVGAAVKGGNILKGALFGAIMGGITAGVASAFSAPAAASAGPVAVDGVIGTEAMTDAAWGSAGAANTEALNSAVQSEGLLTSQAPVAADQLDGAIAPSGAPVQASSAQPVAVQPAQVGQGVGTTGGSTAIGGQSAVTTGVGGAPKGGGILNQMFGADGKIAGTGLMIGGQMLLGSAQQKAQDAEIARRQTNMTWVPVAQRGVYK